MFKRGDRVRYIGRLPNYQGRGGIVIARWEFDTEVLFDGDDRTRMCLDSDNSIEPETTKSGDIIVIGPECFASEDAEVICWRGVNYVKQEAK